LFENILNIKISNVLKCFEELNCNKLTIFAYLIILLIIGRDAYVTPVHIVGNIIGRYYWYHKLIMRVMYVYNSFRSQRTETDTWNRCLLLIKMLLSLIYASLYEGTHQSHLYFQSLVLQTRFTLKLFFPLWEREIMFLSRIYVYSFQKIPL